MSLINLKSIFDEELKQRTEDYVSNQIQGTNDTKFFNVPPNPTIHIATNPTDFSTANGNNNSPYIPLTFNPGESYLSTLPLTPLGELGQSSLDGLSWETLYNPDHSPINNPLHKGVVPISYSNVNRDKLDIRNNESRVSIFSPSRTQLLGLGAGEPYMVSEIPRSDGSTSGGRLMNLGSREVPVARALTDTARITKYLTSPAGLTFILKQNFLGQNSKSIFLGKDGVMYSSSQRFKETYNPLSTLLQTLGRAGGGPVGLVDKTEPGLSSLFGTDKYPNTNLVGGNVEYNINKTFTDGSSAGSFGFSDFGKQLVNTLKGAAGVPVPIKEKSSGGDGMTLAKIIKGDSLQTTLLTTTPVVENIPKINKTIAMNIESEENGMPFYFKDLRKNTYIFFRAYIEGLTENISPSYASHNYIGRSEPVYTYERAEREISFTLKLIAQTAEELKMIYKKMDRLTSMCYPQYVGDDYGNRMKPPLAKLRYGELFGKANKELMGYIKSISYSVEQSSTYETKKGKRVPRHVTATIGYQVIHNKTPRLGTKFYGINQ